MCDDGGDDDADEWDAYEAGEYGEDGGDDVCVGADVGGDDDERLRESKICSALQCGPCCSVDYGRRDGLVRDLLQKNHGRNDDDDDDDDVDDGGGGEEVWA